MILDGDDITRLGAVARARRGLRRTFQRVQTFGWLTRRGQRARRARVARWWRRHARRSRVVPDPPAPRAAAPRARGRGARAVRAVGRRQGAGGLAADRPGADGRGRAGRSSTNPKVLMLDEPTSGLDATEIEPPRRAHPGDPPRRRRARSCSSSTTSASSCTSATASSCSTSAACSRSARPTDIQARPEGARPRTSVRAGASSS